MAYTPGLYTAASAAAATERERYAQAQRLNEERAARERAGLRRQQVAQMDQFTAGLTPRSEVALPDWTAPAAPPMPADLKAPASGGGADSGAASGEFYERDRAMRNYKLLEDQYNSELAAQKAEIDSLGREKYILEQQLRVAPPNMQPRIRAALARLNGDIAAKVGGTRERVTTFRGWLDTISKNIRDGDYNRANIAAQSVGELPAAQPRGTMPERETQPVGIGESGRASAIPVPDSIGFTGAAGAAGAAAPGTAGAPGAAPASRAGLAGLPPYVVDTPGTYTGRPLAPAETREERYSPFAVKTGLAEIRDNKLREQAVNKIVANLRSADVSAATQLYEEFFGTAADAKEKSYARYFKANVMLPWFEENRERIQADPVLAGRAAANPLEFFKENHPEGQYFEIPKLVAAEFASSEYTQRSPAGAPTPVADAAAAQTVTGGKTDLQAAPGVTPPQTPEAVSGAYPALDIPAATPLTGDPARVKAITEFSANAVAERIPERIPLIGPAVQSEKGQEYLARADEFEVPRAALVAVWGIESAFGKDKRKNPVSGTYGDFHVQREQLDRLKKFYTDKAYQREQRIVVPPKFTKLANEIFAGGMEKVESVDAALLQLKMIELLGIPPNLWGAAYQGDAWAVRKLGAPTPTHDAGKEGTAGLTSSDYNTYFATLYNEARVVANTPMTTGTERPTEVSTFNLEKYDREQVRVESDLNYSYQTAETARANATKKYQDLQRRLEVAKQFGKYDEAQTILAEIEGVATNLTAVEDTVRQAERAAELKIEELNLARIDEYINIAVNELMVNNNPKPFADMVSRGTGQLVEIVPVENSTLVQVYVNNELISGGGITATEARDLFLPKIKASAAAEQAATAEKNAEFEREVLLEKVKIQGKIAEVTTLEELKQNAEFQKLIATNKLTKSSEEMDPVSGKLGKIVFTDERGNIIEYTMGVPTMVPGTNVVTRPEPQVKVTRATGPRPPTQ
jgi:hypothetical protein